MNPTATSASLAAPTGEAPTRLTIRPRYEGSNIGTWIGFKHVNYLVEEAVLDHMRQRGYPAGALYERHGLCVDISDIDTKILSAFHMDDVAVATVAPIVHTGPGLRFAVELAVDRGERVKAASANVYVSLRLDPGGWPAEPPPAELAPYVVPWLGRPAEPIEVSGDPLDQLTAGRNAFGWVRRIPYFYCHFTERMQMSGYLRQLEETFDLFAEDRGVSVRKLLDEQSWIPAVPRSRITILDEARMQEELYTILAVENVFKRFTFTARMDCYVLRDGKLVRTATGQITHGWAVIEGRRDWSLVRFDDRLSDAINGEAGGTNGRGRSR